MEIPLLKTECCYLLHKAIDILEWCENNNKCKISMANFGGKFSYLGVNIVAINATRDYSWDKMDNGLIYF